MRDAIVAAVNPLIALIFASVFFAVWLTSDRRREVLAFAASYLLLAIGFMWSQLAPEDAVRLHVKLTNIPYAIGTLLLVWGAARRVGASISLPFAGVVTAITATLFIAAHFYDGATMVELYVANTGYGILFLLAAQATAPSRNRTATNRLVFWMVSLTAVQFLIRPTVSFLLAGPVAFETYHQSTYYSIVNAVVALNSLGLAGSLVAAVMVDRFKSLQDAAALDPLSGLLMRGTFEARAARMLENAGAQGVPVSIILCDIDHFKRINDVWGHPAGDRAIAAVGAVLSAEVRGKDIVGRVGGEEFCILVLNAEGSIAERIAERMRASIARVTLVEEKGTIGLTASFGTAQWRGAETYDSLFARVDEALYRAKSEGRDRTASASPAPATTTTIASIRAA